MPSQLSISATDSVRAVESRRTVRRRQGAAGLLAALALGLAVAAGTQSAGAVVPSAGGIDITVVSGVGSPACLAPTAAATATVFITELTYTVTIRAHAPICQPVTAVIYSMPANPLWPWPQHRLESKTVTIGVGITTIVFTRGCAPTQFDVVTGGAPDTIQPNTGPMPGPMLFANPWTGVQNWNGPCPGTTTVPATSSSTTAPTSTTSTVAQAPLTTSTSTTPSTVPGPTTVTSGPTAPSAVKAATQMTDHPRGVDDASASVEPVVMDATARRSGVDAATAARPLTTASPSDLAVTGATSAPLELAGTSLVLLGAALAVLSRRRRGATDQAP